MADERLTCWEVFDCHQRLCPVYKVRESLCWLRSENFCRDVKGGSYPTKAEMCLDCEIFRRNMDPAAMRETFRSLQERLNEPADKIQNQDDELESLSMELTEGLWEIFEALLKLASGDPFIRIPESSNIEIVRKLKRLLNLTAEEFSEIVELSHEFAIGLAEHFDVLHRVTSGDLRARVTGCSKLELLELLKKMTNQMIESVAREISERKRTERALRESEYKYRSLFDSGPDPIFVLDRETFEILDVNASTEETYGYSREELVGNSFLDLGLFEDDDTGFSFFSADTDRVPRFSSSKLRHFKKGHKPFYVNVHACPTNYKEREAVIFSVTDITEMLEKDSQLIQASKMTTLGELSAGIAHELNQPLNAIKMGSEYVAMLIEKGDKIPDASLSQIIQDVNEQVDRATEIINRLREFGRKADFGKEKTCINLPVRDVLAIIGHQLSLQNITVHVKLDDSLSPVLAQKNKLEQITFNLLTNARDAINQKRDSKSEDGRAVIMVRTYDEKGRVVLSVSDTGAGIPRHLLERVFEPFFTTKEVGKGVGLGLTITYNIVKEFEGDIHVESEEGRGTTFRIAFPCYTGLNGSPSR